MKIFQRTFVQTIEISLFLAIHYTQVDDSFSSGLKGQNIIAQGKVLGGTNRNAALGKGCRRKTVRENMMNKANNSFRTELS